MHTVISMYDYISSLISILNEPESHEQSDNYTKTHPCMIFFRWHAVASGDCDEA